MSLKCWIKAHSRLQLECKWTFAVDTDRRRSANTLDLYFGVPAQLEMHPGRYTTARFFQDVKSYTRLVSPRLDFEQLADAEDRRSPLCQIRRILEEAGDPASCRDRITYELRVFSSICRRRLRLKRIAILDAADGGAPAENIADRLAGLFAGFDRLREAFGDTVGRGNDRDRADNACRNDIREAIRWTDESLSLSAEREWARLHTALLDRSDDLAEQRDALLERLAAEERYRRDRGYDAVLDIGDDYRNRGFIERLGILKKWIHSALYLNREKTPLPRRIADVLAAVSAATAMAVALVISLLSERWFPGRGLPWVLLAVLAYAFKDRIKVWLRGILTAHAPGLVTDRLEVLTDPLTGNNLGRSRARFTHVEEEDLPPALRPGRLHRYPLIERDIPPDDILYVHKKITVRPRNLRTDPHPFTEIVDIIRLKLDRWLRYMDDPLHRLVCVAGGEPRTITAMQVYVVPVVMRVSNEKTGTAETRRARVVLNRDGIVAVEHVRA